MSPTDLPPEGLTPLPYAFPLVPSSLRPVPPAIPAKAAPASTAAASESSHTAPTRQTPNPRTLTA